MLAELLNAVINLARQNQDPLVVAEDGRAAPGEENAEDMRLYATRGMKEIKPPRDPKYTLTTLEGLVAFIKDGPDGMLESPTPNDDLSPVQPLVIHVRTPTLVELDTAIKGPWRERDTLVTCQPVGLPNITLERFMDPESFLIMLMTAFKDGGDRAEVVKLVGTLETEAITNLSDDGFTQKATARTGVAHVGQASVKNPITLLPFRTFAEVDQPASQYVIRLKGGGDKNLPHVALFPICDGKWQAKALANVKADLEKRLKEAKISLPVIL